MSREVGEHPEAFAEYLNVLWQQKNLTPETFETLPDPAQTKDQIKQLELSDTDAFLVQKACNEIYATYGEEAQTLGIHLKKEGEHLIFTSYGKEIRLHLTTKTLEGFVTEGNKIITFGNLAEQIKAANFINVIKYHAKQMTALANPIEHGTPKYAIHPFYIDSYGNLMFRGTGENTTVATGIHRSFNRLPGLNNAIEANSPTLNAHKEVFVSYLNKQEPPFWSRYTQ
ncbi:MAG: hypothetical protein LBG59_01050 [Candidatus Peribacteria bacterium]|nr:hypothetical protein [Candidatus Peribacteria bacterium]